MRRSIVLATLFALPACSEPHSGEAPDTEAPTPQAISLLGEPLYAMEDTTGAIALADEALAAAPDDVEMIIEAGRVRRNYWQYRDAMALYSRAAELAPDDWRPYRFRGHRHISVREFDPAVRDLERARELAPHNWDVSYHLGLAYFVSGRFGDAADEYLRCLGLAEDAEAIAFDSEDFRSCSRNGFDAESRVAMTEWAVRALLRADRAAEAEALVATIPPDLDVSENVAYYHDLLYDQGLKTADGLLNPGPDAPYRLETVGFGVANRLLVAGDTARAMDIFQRIVADPWWPGFGRIAAEAELARR